jgi:hypothetical protein
MEPLFSTTTFWTWDSMRGGKLGASEALVSYVRDDPCSREDQRNNNTLVQLLLLLEFKRQVLTFAFFPVIVA